MQQHGAVFSLTCDAERRDRLYRWKLTDGDDSDARCRAVIAKAKADPEFVKVELSLAIVRAA